MRRLSQNMPRWARLTSCFLLALPCIAVPARAQFENPEEKIREIAEEVAEQLAEIDRLLLQRPNSGSSGSGSAAEGMRQASEKMKKLLDQTTDSQQNVVKKMDELIEQVLKAQQGQQGQGGGQQSQGQPRQQGRTRTGERTGTRRENEPRQGTQRSEQEDPSQSRGPEPDAKQQGQNRTGAQEPEDPTERLQRALETEEWGQLQQYDPLIKSRGGQPKVPEKYRRYLESFIKKSNESARERSRRRR